MARVAEDVAGECDDRWLMPGRVAGTKGAQYFVAGNGIDPDVRRLHFLQHFGGWAGFHGETRLHALGIGQKLDVGDPLADDTGVIEPEGRADFFGERAEQGGRMIHGKGGEACDDWGDGASEGFGMTNVEFRMTKGR